MEIMHCQHPLLDVGGRLSFQEKCLFYSQSPLGVEAAVLRISLLALSEIAAPAACAQKANQMASWSQ